MSEKFAKFRGHLNRCTKRPPQDSVIILSTPGTGNLRFTAQITGFPAYVSNPQGGKSTNFSAGKCHLLYFVVVKSWFSGRGWGQQLLSFQSPAVHWMARSSSLNCLSCRILTKPLIHWIASPPFTENPFFHWKLLRRLPFPKIGSRWFRSLWKLDPPHSDPLGPLNSSMLVRLAASKCFYVRNVVHLEI